MFKKVDKVSLLQNYLTKWDFWRCRHG